MEKWCLNGKEAVNGGFSVRVLRRALMGLDSLVYVHLVLRGTLE